MGHSYINSSGKVRSERRVKEPCPERCIFECPLNFNIDERTKIHKNFWSLNGDQKNLFLAQFIKRISPKRKRVKDGSSRRMFTYVYYFDIMGKRLQVCKKFFKNTLDITEKKIYWYFNHLHNDETGKPNPPPKKNRARRRTVDVDKVTDNSIEDTKGDKF